MDNINKTIQQIRCMISDNLDDFVLIGMAREVCNEVETLKSQTAIMKKALEETVKNLSFKNVKGEDCVENEGIEAFEALQALKEGDKNE